MKKQNCKHKAIFQFYYSKIKYFLSLFLTIFQYLRNKNSKRQKLHINITISALIQPYLQNTFFRQFIFKYFVLLENSHNTLSFQITNFILLFSFILQF